MTKNQYLDELKKELKSNNVPDMNDIIAEYEEHFKFKIEEGKTEEEIARKLSSPKEIAKEYAKINISINKYEKSAKITGLTFLSIPLSLVYIMICASVVVLGVFSITSLVTGFCLITTLNIAGLIPLFPGGLGARDLAIVTILASSGIQPEDAKAAQVIYTSLVVLFALSGGIFFVFDRGRKKLAKEDLTNQNTGITTQIEAK